MERLTRRLGTGRTVQHRRKVDEGLLFYIGTIPAVVFLYLMMIPPQSSTFVMFAYLTLTSSLMVSFLSLMAITHLAMGFEMTTDYDERTRILGYKNLFENLAVLIATFSVPLALNREGTK